MIVFMKVIQNGGSRQILEEPLSPPLKIELYKNGEEWVGSTDYLEPAFYKYKLVYSLYEKYLGTEFVTIEKEGKDPMYLTIQ
jgi:hypothetical protein